ncbi:MAG: TRAP transporter small permease [Oscillospiraceae bacterium]|nr:TRAP transporter small permease [Oscillospiraceae bacterium]
MKKGQHRNEKIDAKLNIRSEHDKNIGRYSKDLKLKKEFWITLVGAIGIVVFAMLDWLVVDESGFSLFALWFRAHDAYWLLDTFREASLIRLSLTMLSLLLILSLMFLLISLIRFKAKTHVKLACCGFGLSVFVSVMFVVVILIFYGRLDRLTLTSSTPVLFAIASVAMSMLVRYPRSVGDVIKIITRIFLYISYASMLILLVLTVVDVVRRFIFGIAMTGVTEYSQILLIISMTAIAHTLVEGRYVAVGTLVELFPKRLNLAIEVIMGVLSFAFFLMVGSQYILLIESSIRFREAYFMIGVPRWPLLGVLGASFLACALGTVVYVYERIVKFKAPNEKDVFDDPELSFMALIDEENGKNGGEE